MDYEYSRKLPVGIQDFEKLRTENCLYVDKTQYVYQLAQIVSPYFLGRPRRFGKSLFLSTLKAYFEGKRELFEGLEIAGLEKDWIKYPVIYLDFNSSEYSDVQTLEIVLDYLLKKYEKEYGMQDIEAKPSIRFDNLITAMHEKTSRKVVVLIDKYDKSLINTMDKPDVNGKNRDVLKGFYGALKGADAHLRFVFLTGVTQFSKVSIFSDLNQLRDISMSEQYAGICGISERELIRNFEPELQALAAKRGLTRDEAFAEMKKRYDGYHFAKVSEDMYNPFSILNTFMDLDFAYYWFATGTPTFLAEALRNQNYDIRKFEDDVYIAAISVMDYRYEDQNLVPLLYQSGYLTIKAYDSVLDEYTLGFPNEEVKYGFLNELLPAFVLTPIATGKFSVTGFLRQLMKNDVESFMTSLQTFFAAIPYDAIKQKHRDEQYYQHVFYLLFILMEQFVETEVKNNKGRTDAVVKTAGNIYVFEFKMDSKATAEDALKQINSKDYAIPYTADHQQAVKIGVEFSQTEWGIKRWLTE
ncbi:MAG: ATP-binding protein [Tannerella sp.]|nr:ATP-binding protein [Tannerella sp.]